MTYLGIPNLFLMLNKELKELIGIGLLSQHENHKFLILLTRLTLVYTYANTYCGLWIVKSFRLKKTPSLKCQKCTFYNRRK